MVFAGCHPDRKHFAKGKCKSCYNAIFQQRMAAKKKIWSKTWRRKSEWTIKSGQLRRKYGMFITDYMIMLAEQGDVCAICKNPEKRLGRGGKVQPLSVDHDHKTGVVRGLLCAGCNGAIHKADLNIEWLESAARYLTDRQQQRRIRHALLA